MVSDAVTRGRSLGEKLTEKVSAKRSSRKTEGAAHKKKCGSTNLTKGTTQSLKAGKTSSRCCATKGEKQKKTARNRPLLRESLIVSEGRGKLSAFLHNAGRLKSVQGTPVVRREGRITSDGHPGKQVETYSAPTGRGRAKRTPPGAGRTNSSPRKKMGKEVRAWKKRECGVVRGSGAYRH